MERTQIALSAQTKTATGRMHGLEVFRDGAREVANASILLTHAAEQTDSEHDLVRQAREVLKKSVDSQASYIVSFEDIGGWRAEMRLALQNGGIVISEFHLIPAADKVPPGGVTSRLLRRVRVNAHTQDFARKLKWPHSRFEIESLLMAGRLEGLLAGVTQPEPRGAASRRGRRPLSVETLLEAAEAYDAAMKSRSKQPVRDAARFLRAKYPDASPPWSPWRVRDLVHRARGKTLGRSGNTVGPLLTETEQGVVGGRLTEEAKALLKKQRRKASPRPRRRKAKP